MVSKEGAGSKPAKTFTFGGVTRSIFSYGVTGSTVLERFMAFSERGGVHSQPESCTGYTKHHEFKVQKK